MKNPDPVTYEQALMSAMLWTKKAGQIALAEERMADARTLAVAAAGIERVLVKVQGTPEDPADMAPRLAPGALRGR